MFTWAKLGGYGHLDDAITHLRAFNEQLMQRATDWSFVSEPGLTVGEKITPISSVGLFVPLSPARLLRRERQESDPGATTAPGRITGRKG